MNPKALGPPVLLLILFTTFLFSGCLEEDPITVTVWYNFHPYSGPGDPLSYNVTLGFFDVVTDTYWHNSTGITPDVEEAAHAECPADDPKVYIQVWNEDYGLWREATVDVSKTPCIIIDIGPNELEIDLYKETPGFK